MYIEKGKERKINFTAAIYRGSQIAFALAKYLAFCHHTAGRVADTKKLSSI